MTGWVFCMEVHYTQVLQRDTTIEHKLPNHLFSARFRRLDIKHLCALLYVIIFRCSAQARMERQDIQCTTPCLIQQCVDVLQDTSKHIWCWQSFSFLMVSRLTQVYSGLQIYCFNWSLKVWFVIVLSFPLIITIKYVKSCVMKVSCSYKY